jgi:hypothetical protein
MSNLDMHVVSALCLALMLQTPPVQQRPLVAGQSQLPGRDQIPRPPVIGKGSIAGTAVSENGQPLKGARVSLNGGVVGRNVVTDATGAFLFDKLPEGRYSLSASRPRFLSSNYGQKRPERSGTPIQLADAEQIKGLTITLFSAGVITGAIFSDDGEPVQGAQVRAMRYVMNSGIRRLQQSNSVQSDDRGFYRIFGLAPGEYLVTATSNQGDPGPGLTAEMQVAIERAAAAAAASGQPFNFSMNGSVLTLPNGQTMDAPSPVTFAPTYYPGSATPASAVTITVRGGEERSGVDIPMQKVQTATVSGTVMSASGPLPSNVSIQMQSNDDAGQGIGLPSARVGADGRFSLRAVPPGQYTITARATTMVRTVLPAGVANGPQPGGQMIETLSMSGGQQMVTTVPATSTGRAVVSVDGQSVTGVVIALDAGRTLTGRVVFDGVAQPDPTKVRMVAMLQPAPSARSLNAPSPSPGEIGPDGNFKISGIAPGRYTLRVTNAQGLSMKSSIVAGRDSLDFPFEIDSEDIHGAVVTMGAPGQPSELSGFITDMQGKPAVDYTIVVFTSDQRFWAPGSRRIFTLRPGTDGKYTLRGAPAGDYQIAAMSDLEPGTQYDPELLKTLLVASTRVTLGEGAKLTQDLRVNNR